MRLIFKLIQFPIPALVYVYLTFRIQPEVYESLPSRLLLFACCALLGTLVLSWKEPASTWKLNLFLVALSIAIAHRIMLFSPEISTTPWSLNWSEGSRYYYASSYVPSAAHSSSSHYSVLHPTRYMLQALAFFVPNSPIWFHRLWQVLLWIGTTVTSSWLLARRLRQGGASITPLAALTYVGWSFLFLMQGPVYYNLLVIVMLILWGARPERFGHTLVVVLLASIWAGLSRLNWYPMPGLLATAVYLLEQPLSMEQPTKSLKNYKDTSRTLYNYYRYPVVWVISGTLAAFLSYWFYGYISGIPLEYFASPFTSSLLWYRLFPNPTNPAGILPSIILVSVPLWLIIYSRAKTYHDRYDAFRLSGLLGILVFLFGGGLVVSVKIGGGSNLHNLDAYLVMLWLTGTYSFYPIGLDIDKRQPRANAKVFAWPALLIPVILTLSLTAPTHQRNEVLDQVDLLVLQDVLSPVDGDVLFITERQLITFGEISNLTLIPEYENLFLMEMAMANNEDYFRNFHAALARQQYSYIVSNPLFIVYKGRKFPFGEENDAWVKQVSEQVLCYYEPIMTLNRVNVQVLSPRGESCNTQSYSR